MTGPVSLQFWPLFFCLQKSNAKKKNQRLIKHLALILFEISRRDNSILLRVSYFSMMYPDMKFERMDGRTNRNQYVPHFFKVVGIENETGTISFH